MKPNKEQFEANEELFADKLKEIKGNLSDQELLQHEETERAFAILKKSGAKFHLFIELPHRDSNDKKGVFNFNNLFPQFDESGDLDQQAYVESALTHAKMCYVMINFMTKLGQLKTEDKDKALEYVKESIEDLYKAGHNYFYHRIEPPFITDYKRRNNLE